VPQYFLALHITNISQRDHKEAQEQILGFPGHSLLQLLSYFNTKVAVNSQMNGHGYVPVKLFTQVGGRKTINPDQIEGEELTWRQSIHIAWQIQSFSKW
jgi:hypothetical protein